MNTFPTYYRILRISARVATVGGVTLYTLPHLFPERLTEVTFRFPFVDVPKQYHDILRDACEKMDIDPDHVKLFFTNGFSTVSAGATYFHNKSVIGLPRNYSFQTEDEIRKADIRFKDKPIDWDSNTGQAMVEVMLPDEEHLKFLLGHELSHIKNSHFVWNSLHVGICFYSFFKLATWLPPRIPYEIGFGRLVLGHFVYLMAAIYLYQVMKKHLNHRKEFLADKESALLGKDYCVGGINYMKTRLRLNRILRYLNGDSGETLYSKAGNNLKDTNTHPKRTDRLKQLEKLLISDFSE